MSAAEHRRLMRAQRQLAPVYDAAYVHGWDDYFQGYSQPVDWPYSLDVRFGWPWRRAEQRAFNHAQTYRAGHFDGWCAAQEKALEGEIATGLRDLEQFANRWGREAA